MTQPITTIKSDVVSTYYTPRPKDRREITIGCKITSQEFRMLDVLIQDTKTKLPWKTRSDYLYWCFVNGTRKVSGDLKTERFTNLFNQIEQTRDLLKESEIRRQVMQLWADLQREVQVYDEEGAGREVPRLLRNFERRFFTGTQHNFWVKKVKKQFDQMYGKRIKADRLSNHPEDAEREE